MAIGREGDLQISIPNTLPWCKFDEILRQEKMHSCMKAVDFVIELPEAVFLIEFKDPDDPNASAHPDARARFRHKLDKETLTNALKIKCRDSWLYRWLNGDTMDKEIHFYVLIAMEDLTPEILTRLTENLQAQLPLLRPNSKEKWGRKFITRCGVFNLRTWNQRFPQLPITRLSASQGI